MEFNGLIIRNYKIVKMFLHSKKLLLLIIGFLAIVLSSSTKVVIADNPPPAGNWVLIKDLKVGDLLKTENGWTEIESIEYIQEPITVYNLSVSRPNTFFANGILAHNKSCSISHNVYGIEDPDCPGGACHLDSMYIGCTRDGHPGSCIVYGRSGVDPDTCDLTITDGGANAASCSIYANAAGYDCVIPASCSKSCTCGGGCGWTVAKQVVPTLPVSPTPIPAAFIQGRISTEHALPTYYCSDVLYCSPLA